jgi:acyl-CoA thioester hydrolase
VRASLRDIDGLGHVNNAVYVTWFEEARTHWLFERMGLKTMEEFAFVLASTEIHFRSPVHLHERVEIRLVPIRVGSKSWELAYEGRAVEDGRLVVEGRSVQVQYDFAAKTSIPLQGAWRRMLVAESAA